MNWKPINTAPKDGTLILTIDIKLPNSYSVRKWEVDDYGDGQWQPRIRGVFPTHWICLPKYPMTIK